MHPDQDALTAIGSFVSGKMPTPEFEKALYGNPAMELLLAQERAPRYSHTGHTLFHYLIALHYDDPGDVLTAHGALREFLGKMGVDVVPSEDPEKLHRLLLSAQPAWLNADMAYLSSILATAPELPALELKRWLRSRILERFRYAGRPPRWIQAPNWPMGKDGPMTFLGQVAVDHYFHDSAAVYVFHDAATGECTSIVQTF